MNLTSVSREDIYRSNVITDYWINDGQLLLTRYTEFVTGEELIQSALRKSGDMRFDNVRYILSDWTEVGRVQASTEDIKALVACLRPISQICPDAKSASIVKPDPQGNALVAWYKYLADDLSWQVEIFASIEDATVWCDLYRDFLRSGGGKCLA